jgi:ABC-type transporter Mla MlaB component
MEHQESFDVAHLALHEARTLRTADDTHARLLEMSGRHAVLEIDCSAVDEADLSFIQLLLAARESARRSGRTVRLAHPVTGALREALQRGGFLEAAADQAFWLRPE